MPIRSEQDLEKAMQARTALESATAGSAEAAERDRLDGEVQRYYTEHRRKLEKGRPPSEPDQKPIGTTRP